MGFLKSIKDAFREGAEGTPPRFEIEGKEVKCPHCGNTTFAEGSAQLNTAGMTFVGLDWANKSAWTLMCTECGHIEWFGQQPSRVRSSST